MPANLQGKTALITGASRGLGRAIAEIFWENGANLILLARNIKFLQEFQTMHVHSAQSIKIFSTDLGNPVEVDGFIQKIASQKIDILVNNAAISGPIGPFWENAAQAWNDTLQINLLTPAALCRALIPRMIAQNSGKIINLSGGGATHSRPNFSAYAVAKTGLVRLTEILAEELKNLNISVNAIAPGVMKTDMLADILNAGENLVGEKEYQTARMAEDTLQNPAKLCLFLASNESAGITGKLISATWDPWSTLKDYVETLKNTDIYTLRRIIPEDRGQNFG